MKYREIVGEYDARSKEWAIVASRFNSLVSDRLIEGAVDALERHGAGEGSITVFRVPGAFELPFQALEVARTGRFSAVICLGAIIRGETAHFDLVSSECAKGIAQATLQAGVPVIFGVLTTDSIEQALERAGLKAGNKGFDAAMSAMEMASVRSRT